MEKELAVYIQHLEELGWVFIDKKSNKEKTTLNFQYKKKDISLDFFNEYHPDIIIKLKDYYNTINRIDFNNCNLMFDRLKFSKNNTHLQISTRITNEYNETRLYLEVIRMISLVEKIRNEPSN